MRTIDADALKKIFDADEEGKKISYNIFIVNDKIDSAPTIEERKTGKWQITKAYPHVVYCSECYKRFAQTNWSAWNDEEHPLPRSYCPNCGAKMEGADE